MTGMFAINGDSVSAVRRPVFEVRFGGGGATAGLSAAANLVPSADDPWARSVRVINVETGLAPFVDIVTVDMAADEEAPEVALDDEGTISLGYDDSSAELVFTATVSDICCNVQSTKRLNGVNGGVSLSRLRINQSYEQQSAGEIVTDLAAQAGVDTDAVESGTDLPFYVIDDRRSIWDHIARLAQDSGYGAYITTANRLYFGPLSMGQAVQTFTYGNDILAFQSTQRSGPLTGYKVLGEGAAGSEGDDAWCWIVKDPASVTAETGDGPGTRLVARPALRSAEAVQAAADGLAAAGQRRLNTGRVLTAGAPVVTVGSTIELADLPVAAFNGACLVTRVIHEYSKRHGFVSRIDFGQTEANGIGGLL